MKGDDHARREGGELSRMRSASSKISIRAGLALDWPWRLINYEKRDKVVQLQRFARHVLVALDEDGEAVGSRLVYAQPSKASEVQVRKGFGASRHQINYFSAQTKFGKRK